MIDASGTWRQPNPAGADGLPALGERAAAGLIRYHIPDFAAPGPFAGRHTIVVGSGHSAATAVIELARIAGLIRAPGSPGCCAAGSAVKPSAAAPPTSCPSAAPLGMGAKQAVEAGLVELVTGFRAERIRR